MSPPQLSTEPAAAASRTFLPLHLVGLVTVPEAEGSGEVAAQELLLLDAAEDGLVDGLLVSGTGGGNLLLLLRETCTLVMEVRVCGLQIRRSIGITKNVPRASRPA
jgi:hypothetical protein